MVFGTNAVGLIVGTRCAAYVGLARGLVLLTVGAAAVLLSGLTGAGLVLLLPSFFLVGTAFGMCIPTVSANAMQAHPHSAGAASALLGATQFVVGGGVGPLAGRGASDGPVFLGAVMTGLALTALALGWASRGGHQLSHGE